MILWSSTNEAETRTCKPKQVKKQYLKLRPLKHGQEKVWFTLEAEMRRYAVPCHCNARRHRRPGTVKCTARSYARCFWLCLSQWDSTGSFTPKITQVSNFPLQQKTGKRGRGTKGNVISFLTQYVKKLNLRKIFNWNPNKSASACFKPLILTKASPLLGLI